MSVLPIVTLGDPRLRMPGEPVRHFDKMLGRLIDDMIETMRDAPGVGLAAQQIGLPVQLCVIEVEGDLFELANPRILHTAGEQTDYEGCLSIPGYYAERTRPAHTTVEAYNRKGRLVRVSGTELLARAIQHEFDHLLGELFVDRLPAGTEMVTVARLRAIHEAEELAESA